MSNDILNKINSPKDLKALTQDEVLELAEEIREFLIENVGKTGGHLASNLGVVELTLALHRVFDAPHDKIIFDVGHQSYVHKLITGRKDKFSTLRTTGGLSGFTTRREGEYDPFGAGHSSTSISAALGFAEANVLTGSDGYSVAVIGDGAFTGGMAHEAINNCRPDLKLVIVLNENKMSISKNRGTFASYLARVRVSEKYLKWKKGTNSFLKHVPLIGKPIIFLLSLLKNKLKKLVYSTNYFEDIGLDYIGPVNGNDYKSVEKALSDAKKTGRCCIVHTYTKKGKGYEAAEKSPDDFHSVRKQAATGISFHEQAAQELIELAARDEKITAITAAMGIGTGLSRFGDKFPKRYYDVGIAEGHALTFSAGLAAAGFKPYCAIYSTFLQRGYDNILHDIALQGLPVRLLIDRAALSLGDGATHHGIFDIAFLMHTPGVEFYAPATFGTLKTVLERSVAAKGPYAIRYPDGTADERIEQVFYSNRDFSSLGVRPDFEKTPKTVLVSVGCSVKYALAAKDILKNEDNSTVGVVLVEKLKPYLDVSGEIYALTKDAEKIIFVEEGIKNGSFSMIIKDELCEKHEEYLSKKIAVVAIDDNFASPTEPCNLYDYVGISPEKIVEKIHKM